MIEFLVIGATNVKCDALNAPSQRAAKRLGFRYDGLFRQAGV